MGDQTSMSRVRATAMLLGAVALAGVSVGVPLAGAAGGTDQGTWSDARWSEQGGLAGPVGTVGVLEVDWQAGTDVSAVADLRLELPSELVPVSATGATPTTVRLFDEAGLPGGTGTWVHEAAAGSFVLEVDLDEAAAETAAGAGERLAGTLEMGVTWSEGAAAGLAAGEQVLEVVGPGLGTGAGTGATELIALYSAPDEASTTTPSRPTLRPTPLQETVAQAQVDEDVTVDVTAEDEVEAEAGTKPKPKPTKPKPTGKPSPDDGDDADGKPGKVTRDAEGREKVKSVPAGPLGVTEMPTIG